MNPPPAQMLFEAAVDAVQALKLLRIGILGEAPMEYALEMVDSTLAELKFAISASLDAKSERTRA